MLEFFKEILNKKENRVKILSKRRNSKKPQKVGTIVHEDTIGNDIHNRCISFKKAGKVMCKAAEVGKIVVNKCLNSQFPIDTQKLQKLLVLMQVDCIRRSMKPLFKEDIRIWDCGVAIKEVDDEFCSYAEGFIEQLEEFITLLDAEEESVDYILGQYGTMDAFELNDLPVCQRIRDLGVIQGTTHVPHITYQILIGAFNNDADGLCT